MKKTRGTTAMRLSVVLVVSFISLHAFSESQIKSEYDLFLPRHFLNTILEKKWQSLAGKQLQKKWQIPEQTEVVQNVPVQFKNIEFTINAFLDRPTLQDGKNQLSVRSKDLEAFIHIGEVIVDQVIERNVGGVIGRFRLQSKCRDVVLSLARGSGDFAMSVSPRILNSKVGVGIEDLHLSWASNTWTLNDLTCSGAFGFEDVLRSGILGMVQDSNRFVHPRSGIFKSGLQNYLNKTFQFDLAAQRILTTIRPDIFIGMNVRDVFDRGQDGFELSGFFEVTFKNSSSSRVSNLALGADSDQLFVSAGKLLLPSDFINIFAEHAYSANSWLHQIDSKKLPGFSGLMSSRVQQFFVWPELLNFSKGSVFKFDFYSPSDVRVSGSGSQYTVNLDLYGQMFATKRNMTVRFMNFWLPFQSNVKAVIQNGRLNLTYSNAKLSISPHWDPDYVRSYDPDRSFAAGTIRNHILDSLEGKNSCINLPLIPIMDGVYLKVGRATFKKGENIRLDISLN